MVEAAPAAPFVVPEAEFLLEFLIIALDPPAQLGEIDQVAERHIGVRRSRARTSSARLHPWRPLDQQRLFAKLRFAPHRRRVHAHTGKARLQFRVAAFAPRDAAPGVLGQAERQCCDADAPRLPIILAHRAYLDGRYDSRHIAQPQSHDPLAQTAVRPVTRIHQHDTWGNVRLQSRADLLQRNLRLGLEPDRSGDMRFSRRDLSSVHARGRYS